MIGLLAVAIALAPAYLVRFHIFGFPTTLLEVLIVAFLLSVVLRFELKDLNRIKKLGAINWAIGLLVVASIISVFISPEKSKALGQLKAFVVEPILVFYGIILIVRNKNQLVNILKGLFLVSILISIFGIFQHYSFIFLPIRFWGHGSEVARIVSIFEYPNALSLYLAPLLGFFTALWLNDYPLTKSKWTAAVGLLIMTIALLLTFSRGAWIAASIGLILVLIQRFGFKRLVLPLVIGGTLLMLMPGVRDRLSLGVSDASSSAHLDLIKVGFDKIKQSPIFGNGLYGFRTTETEAGYTGEILNYPHNILLNLWLELGLLGLISFIWIFVLAFKQYRKRPSTLILAASVYLLIMFIHGLVDVPYFKNDLSLLFWFIISLLFI